VEHRLKRCGGSGVSLDYGFHESDQANDYKGDDFAVLVS
jgi:hypothetical protein